MAQSTCPITAMTSFPLGIEFTPTTGIYNSLPRDVGQLQMQWGTRTTRPGFMGGSNGGIIDEPSDTNTLRYKTNSYNLLSVQIAKATHTAWILPIASQSFNKEDLIFIFTTNAVSTTPILMIIVPIIRNGTARTDPLYLTALDSSREAGSGPYSLKDCLPFNEYIQYTSCLNGYSTEAPTANAVIYVDISGLSVSSELMSSVLQKSFGTPLFPIPVSYFMNKFSRSATVSASTINKSVSISSPFKTFVPPSNAPVTTDNYKCMPLDMTQIQTSDLSGAKTLTQILLPQQKEIQILNPGKLERGISIALGVVMGLMFFGVGIYILWSFIDGTRAAASGAAPTVSIFSKLYSLWPFLLVLLIGISVGVVITVLTAKK